MWFGEPHPFSKEGRLPDWARLDNKATKGGRVDKLFTVRLNSAGLMSSANGRQVISDSCQIKWCPGIQ